MNIEFTDDIIELIYLLEVIDAGFEIKGIDFVRYRNIVELLACTYNDKNFRKVNEAIKYKYSTIEKLRELLERLKIDNICIDIYQG